MKHVKIKRNKWNGFKFEKFGNRIRLWNKNYETLNEKILENEFRKTMLNVDRFKKKFNRVINIEK